MDVDQLRGFYWAARLKSFTAAAKKLYLTQPAISLQIKALEGVVGGKLFDRVGRSIRLTYTGEVLYTQAEEIIGKLTEIERVVSDLHDLRRGRFALGASDTTSLYFLPEILKCFHDRYPEIELEIQSLFSRHVERKVLDREVEVGIITLPPADKRLDGLPLYAQRLVCLVNEAHPLAHRKVLSTDDLSGTEWILLGKESETRRVVDELLGSIRPPPRVVMELSNFEIIKRYVAVGLGISVIPESILPAPADGLLTVPLKQRITVHIGAIYRHDRPLSLPAKSFLAMAREHFSAGGRPGLPSGPTCN
jgi:DNA-binding transcriptional LysR family regulator